MKFSSIIPKWIDVPTKAAELGEEWSGQAERIRKVLEQHPVGVDSELWWHPLEGNIWINEGDAARGDHKDLQKALETTDGINGVMVVDEARPEDKQEWVKVAMAPRGIGEMLQFLPAQYLKGIPSAPSPLAATLATGLLGAGLGYGAGWLGEKLMPDDWQRGRLRKNLAIAGGLAGALPGMMWAGVNHANGRSILDSWPNGDAPPVPVPAWYNRADYQVPEHVKQAMDGLSSRTSMLGGPDIQVDKFNNVVWNDPYVASQLTPQMQAAATGIMTGAAHLAGGGQTAKLISPMDVARFSLGMGSGYLSGAMLGSVAGKMLGAPPHVQDTLKQTGLFAGLLVNLVPKVFGA